LKQANKHTNPFLLTLKGVVMGAANKVPGVSGGIVAFVMGFYEEFIYSLQKFNIKALKLIFSGRFNSFYNYVNGRFLTLLFLGMIISYFSVSKLLDYLIERHELYVWSVFFGMIVGSIYYIYNDFKSWNTKTIVMAFLGILVGLSISFLNPATQNDNLWFVFLCGMISVTGMALPGFSGSFILILLGNYVLLLVDSVNVLFDTFVFMFSGDFSFISDPQHLRLLKVLLVFTLGSVVGLVSLSHLLSYILKHYKFKTLALIMGFITGSLGVVWPWKEALYRQDSYGNFITDTNGEQIIENYQRYLPEMNTQTIYALLFIIFGAAIVLGLEWYGNKRKHYI
jgi:putative membrane protein